MTTYNVYLVKFIQALPGETGDFDSFIELGTVEAINPQNARRKVLNRWEPREFKEEFNLMADQKFTIAAIAENNISEEGMYFDENLEDFTSNPSWR